MRKGFLINFIIIFGCFPQEQPLAWLYSVNNEKKYEQLKFPISRFEAHTTFNDCSLTKFVKFCDFKQIFRKINITFEKEFTKIFTETIYETEADFYFRDHIYESQSQTISNEFNISKEALNIIYNKFTNEYHDA